MDSHGSTTQAHSDFAMPFILPDHVFNRNSIIGLEELLLSTNCDRTKHSLPAGEQHQAG